MGLIKIVTNLTENPLQVLNRELEPNESWSIPSRLWLELIEEDYLDTLISEDKLSVSDGSVLLSKSDALNHIKLLQEEVDVRGGFAKRFVRDDVVIESDEEMILSDFMDIESNGSIDVDGILTIQGE